MVFPPGIQPKSFLPKPSARYIGGTEEEDLESHFILAESRLTELLAV
jgi:hypothetical protein